MVNTLRRRAVHSGRPAEREPDQCRNDHNDDNAAQDQPLPFRKDVPPSTIRYAAYTAPNRNGPSRPHG